LINGLCDAHRSRVPVPAIAAHIPSTEIGIEYFQATHPESLFKECSRYVELVTQADRLPQIPLRAMRVAVSQQDVAVVVIPGDVALKPRAKPVPTWLLPSAPVIRPGDDELRQFRGGCCDPHSLRAVFSSGRPLLRPGSLLRYDHRLHVRGRFIGLTIFGWGKISEGILFFATFNVALSSSLSAMWILDANSWMQT